MAYKKNRPIKVYETSGTDYKRIPQIRLQGKWLQELGFDIGEATVADGCIVAQGAVVNKSFTEQNVLLGGVPARQVADNVEWKK